MKIFMFSLMLLLLVVCITNDLDVSLHKQNDRNRLLQEKDDFEYLLKMSYSNGPEKLSIFNKQLEDYNQLLHSLYNIKNDPKEWYIYYFYRFELYLSQDLEKAQKHAETYCRYLENCPNRQWSDEILRISVLSDFSRICAQRNDSAGMERYFQKVMQEYRTFLEKYRRKILNDPNIRYVIGQLRENVYIAQSINYEYFHEWKQAKQCLDEYLSNFKSEKEYADSAFNNGKLFETQALICYHLELTDLTEKYANASVLAAEKHKIVNLTSYTLLAECFFRKGKYSDALLTCKKAVTVPEGWCSSGDFSSTMKAQTYLLACECCIKLKSSSVDAQKHLDAAEKISGSPEILDRIKILTKEISVLKNNQDS